MSAQRPNWIWDYFLSNNNAKVTCTICNISFRALKFTGPVKYHIIGSHKEEYKNTVKKCDWIWQFYKIEDNNLNCKICNKYYRIPTANTIKIIKHLTDQHKIDESKAKYDVDLRNWITRNLYQFQEFIGNKRQCKLCGYTFQESNSLILIEHLVKYHHDAL